MFLAGLKFAAGLMTGIIVLVGIVLGLGAIGNWVSGWREKRRRSRRMIELAARQSASRERLRLMLSELALPDEPEEPRTRPKRDYLQ